MATAATGHIRIAVQVLSLSALRMRRRVSSMPPFEKRGGGGLKAWAIKQPSVRKVFIPRCKTLATCETQPRGAKWPVLRNLSSWHLLTSNYRPSRHGALPEAPSSPSEPPPEPPASLAGAALYWAFQALPEGVRAWEGLLLCGTDIFRQLPPDIDEKAARRMARRKWHEHGRELIRFWGEERTRKSWAWQRWGSPTR